ncbi:short-chain dehydrogenase/reductase 3 isoform X2 [Tursiops truncatus]|uniref:short-chain dehydrogenase/reductase 3 isoform X2 n=1 Tax=Tursiops truncatus TaxID=9739 RepID=UPI003CCFDE35
MGCLVERLTPDEWKLPGSRDAPEEGGCAPAGPVPARGAAEAAAGRFTLRPADWLRVAMSGGVCSILSVCAAGVTSGRRGGACVALRPRGLEAAGTLHLIYSSGFSRRSAARVTSRRLFTARPEGGSAGGPRRGRGPFPPSAPSHARPQPGPAPPPLRPPHPRPPPAPLSSPLPLPLLHPLPHLQHDAPPHPPKTPPVKPLLLPAPPATAPPTPSPSTPTTPTLPLPLPPLSRPPNGNPAQSPHGTPAQSHPSPSRDHRRTPPAARPSLGPFSEGLPGASCQIHWFPPATTPATPSPHHVSGDPPPCTERAAMAGHFVTGN